MKKSLYVLLVVMMVFLAACGSDSSKGGNDKSNEASNDTKKSEEKSADETGEVQEVTFWHAMTDTHEEWLKKKTDEFNKEHKDIKVKLVGQGNYGDLSQKLLAAAKAKNSPTIAQAYGEWIADYDRNNLVVDLKPMIEGENGFDDKESYDDITEVFRKDNTFGDKVLGLPFNKSTRVLYVNNDYLKKAGLKAPETWEELEAAAEKMTTTVDGKKVVGMGFENGMAHEISMWIKQAGGEFVDEKNNKVLFDSPEGLKALQFINNMLDNGTARMAGEDEYLSGPFTNGDVAMYIGSNAGIPFVEKDAKMDWTTVPLPKGKEAAAPFQGTNITMFASSTEEQQKAAFEYMKYLISKENTIDWAKTTGYLPVRQSALDSEEWQSFVKEHPVHAAGVSQYDGAFIEDRVPDAFAMKEAIGTELDKMLFDDAEPKETLKNMAEKAQAAIDKAKK
ncbi:ABC transporter substrate-binding protein [Macrococcus carouselicus]|nr:ABC transporter substrate-binding protein [Macrococcus carouselicus]